MEPLLSLSPVSGYSASKTVLGLGASVDRTGRKEGN